MSVIVKPTKEQVQQLSSLLIPSVLTSSELATLREQIRRLSQQRFQLTPHDIREANVVAKKAGVHASQRYIANLQETFHREQSAEVARLQHEWTHCTLQGIATRAFELGLQQLLQEAPNART